MAVEKPMAWDDLFQHRYKSTGSRRIVRKISRKKSIGEYGKRADKRARTEGTAAPQRLGDGTLVPARYWGLSRPQLQLIFQVARADPRWSDEDDVRTFVSKFVKPSTAGSGRGVALHLNEDCPLEANLMVSHAWDENAKTFFEDLLVEVGKEEVAYICFLSNYQGTADEIESQLGNNLAESPFTQILTSNECRRMLVIPNEELRASGQGLYSRLWCAWEVKVAADNGVPIHIPTRNSEEYLLGQGGGSSRAARCGSPEFPMNRDEQLIREAVERLPPETGCSHACKVCILIVCGVMGPEIAAALLGRTMMVWFSGLQLGLALAAVICCWCSCWCRPKTRDGYDTLDSIIRSASKGWYATARYRKADALGSVVFMSAFFYMDFLIRLLWAQESVSCAGILSMEVVDVAIPLWAALLVHRLGPWTGLYLAGARDRRLAGSLLLACCGVCGALALPAATTLWPRTFESGFFFGCLIGLAILSMIARKWTHILSNVSTCLAVWALHVLQVGDLDKTVCVLMLGFNGVLLRPEQTRTRLAALIALELATVAALTCMTVENGGTVLATMTKQCKVSA